MEDCKVPDSARSLIIAGIPAYSNWKPYKRWCRENGKKVWTVSIFSDFSFDAAADQLAAFLGDIRNSTTTSGRKLAALFYPQHQKAHRMGLHM